jgi:uncharacterized membrane protein
VNVLDPKPPRRGLESLRIKIGVYVACWATALIVTDPSASLLPLVYMFPLGLFAFFFPHSTASSGWGVLLGTLAFYAVNGVVYFRTRARRVRVIMLAILVLALICNVSGCKRMLSVH